MERYLLISDAAKEVQVESHVLRYWEEELHLPIRRNELGHRYYTLEDVTLFKQIKSMKEGGLQLKAIKMILKDGKINVMTDAQEKEAEKVEDTEGLTELSTEQEERERDMAISIINVDGVPAEEEREEKAKRLQWLLQQLIRETLQENNQEICREIKESVIKELDYQFRVQEEREEERDKLRIQQDEEHFQRLDELLRKKTGRQKLELPRLTRRAEREKKKGKGN